MERIFKNVARWLHRTLYRYLWQQARVSFHPLGSPTVFERGDYHAADRIDRDFGFGVAGFVADVGLQQQLGIFSGGRVGIGAAGGDRAGVNGAVLSVRRRAG